MPVIISNQRVGPLGRYLSKHPRHRDVVRPWRPNGSVAMGAGRSIIVNLLGDLSLLAVRYILTHGNSQN